MSRVSQKDAKERKGLKERSMVQGFWDLRCSRCQMVFDNETEAEDHLNGSECEERKARR